MKKKIWNGKECKVCTGKSNTEICDECNRIYRDVLGATFETAEDIKEFMENEDIPAYTLRKLGREMSVHIYG